MPLIPSVTLGKPLAILTGRTRKLRLRNFNAKIKGDIVYKDDLDQRAHRTGELALLGMSVSAVTQLS